MQKYSVNQHLIETILAWVNSGEIAIPEIQRPFVWDSSKVRDLMDSLYQGYPVGYVIAWRNPNVRLKDGSLSQGKKILIDGQQRITALRAAILGEKVVNKHYQSVPIRIAFHPIKELFEVANTAIDRDKTWLSDISPIITGDLRPHRVVRQYCDDNPDADEDLIFDRISCLCDIVRKQIGLIELAPDLDIETVTDIFIRINSKGVVLSQADFAMSKIASNEALDGATLRKAIDYFCHLAVSPEFYPHIESNDKDFAITDWFRSMSWLRHEQDDLYDPGYGDLLRVAFTYRFCRGKLGDLVSLLSGRDFERRTYEKEIEEESFRELAIGVRDFINETNFKRFLMIIRSAGFIDAGMIRSKNLINFSYSLYLKLKKDLGNEPRIESWVRRWFVMAMLTNRYSASPESTIGDDIKTIDERGIEAVLSDREAALLSDTFWEVALVQDLNTSSRTSAQFNVFLAAQVRGNDRGFLAKDITVRDMLTHHGDIHHVFPRDFLKRHGFSQGRYNQIANNVYLQQEVNIKIGNKPPKEYMGAVFEQARSGAPMFGAITSTSDRSEEH